MAGPSADVFLPTGGGAGAAGGKILGLSRPMFFVAVAGVAVVGYLILRNRSSASSSAGAPTDSSGAATNTGAGTLGDTTGAGAGGAAGGPDWSSLLSAYDQMYGSLITDYQSLVSQLQGVISTSGNTSGQPGGNNSTPAAPSVPNAPTTTPGGDNSVSPAQSFYPAGTDVSGGSSPLYAYESGTLIAASPIAGSVFNTHTPAAAGYEALGIAPSSPVTLVPVPMTSGNRAPQSYSVPGTRLKVQ